MRPLTLLVIVSLFSAPSLLRAGEFDAQLETAHFRFEFEEGQRKVAEKLAANAEAIRTRHCRLIAPCWEGPIEVQIAESQEQFLDLQPYQAHIDWAAGVAYGALGLIILRVDKAILLTIEETFEHEVSHILLLKAVKQRPPRWFIEGMAIVQAEQDLISRFEEVAAATINDGALSLDAIALRFPSDPGGRSLAYAQSGLFVSYLVNRFSEKAIRGLVRGLSKRSNFKRVFKDTLGVSLPSVEADWKGELGRFGWLKALTDSWLLWGVAALLLVLGLGRQLRQRRRSRDRLSADDGADWEYRSDR